MSSAFTSQTDVNMTKLSGLNQLCLGLKDQFQLNRKFSQFLLWSCFSSPFYICHCPQAQCALLFAILHLSTRCTQTFQPGSHTHLPIVHYPISPSTLPVLCHPFQFFIVASLPNCYLLSVPAVTCGFDLLPVCDLPSFPFRTPLLVLACPPVTHKPVFLVFQLLKFLFHSTCLHWCLHLGNPQFLSS